MRKLTALAGGVALMLSCSALAAAGAGRVVIPSVAMEDQHERRHDVKERRGHVVVLIYGDKASARANTKLGARLHVHYHPAAKGASPEKARQAAVKPVAGAPEGSATPDVLTIPVACHKTTSNIAKATIRALIKFNAGAVPVWLDFDDVMKRQFPFRDGVPNVVVLDAKGRYRYAAAGQPSEAGVARLIAVIDQLRQEAVEGR